MKIIGIDPGSLISGIVLLGDKGEILAASNSANTDVPRLVADLLGGKQGKVVIEDFAPYVGRLSPNAIDTCKWIGELTFRLKNDGLPAENLFFVPRNTVKKWIYDTCPEICIPRIKKKLIAVDKRRVAKGEKGLKRNDGQMRAPSFNWVDDRVVEAALRHLRQMPPHKPFQKNPYGLTSHSWQALALCEYILQHTASAQNDENTLPQQGIL